MKRLRLFCFAAVFAIAALWSCQTAPPAKAAAASAGPAAAGQPPANATSPLFVSTVAGDGTYVDSGDGGPAILAGLHGPHDLALDSAGNLYISEPDSARVRRIDASGIITTVAGNGEGGFSGDGGPAVSASLQHPGGIAVDSNGDLFIADSWNNRVRKVDSKGIITTIAGTGEAGYFGDGGPALQARLQRPVSVAVDPDGNVFVSDQANQRVRKIVVTTGMIVNVAGNGNGGFSGDGGSAVGAEINSPEGIAVDSAGALYIADSANYRVRKVVGGRIRTVAGSGKSGIAGDGRRATDAAMFEPSALALDGSGTLYIADLSNAVIRAVDGGGVITKVLGFGGLGFDGDGGRADAAVFSQMTAVAVDPSSGDLYATDLLNNRVREAGRPINKGVTVRNVSLDDISPSEDNAEAAPIGSLLLRNTEDAPASHVTVSVLLPGLMDSPQDCASFDVLNPQEQKAVDLGVHLKPGAFGPGTPGTVTAQVSIRYSQGDSAAAPVTTSINAHVVPFSNRLVQGGIGLSVPDGAVFGPVDAAAPVGSGQSVFSFSDSRDALTGQVTRYTPPDGTDAHVLIELWRRWAQDTWPGSAVTASEDRSGVTVEAAVPGGALHMVRMMEDDKQLVSIQIDSARSQAADVQRGQDILRSGRLLPADAQERIVPGGPLFVPLNGEWSWYRDVPGGMMIHGTLMGRSSWLGIWHTSATDTAALAAQARDFDIPAFDAWFLIDNRQVPCRGSGYSNHGGATEMYFVVGNGSARYCIALTVPGTLRKTDYAAAADALRQVVAETMRFPEAG